MTVVEHIDSFEYLILGKHLPLLSHSVHRVEQVLVLNVDGNAERGGRRLKLRAEPVERRRVVLCIDEHYHDEIILHDGLRNVLDIDAQLRELARDRGDYARPVPAYDRYYCFHASIISQCYRLRNKCAALFVRYRLLPVQNEHAHAPPDLRAEREQKAFLYRRFAAKTHVRYRKEQKSRKLDKSP